MKNKLLSISQVAKLRKITPETLRHYDRIGLIKPVYVDPHTNYRYYSIRQYELIGTVKELRQMGMSLDTIVSYFNDRNLKQSVTILDEHRRALKQKIEEQQKILAVLERKMDFLSSLNDLPELNVIVEKNLPGRDILSFGEKAGGPKKHAMIFSQLEYELNEIAPIVASARMGVYGDASILDPSDDNIPCVPMIFLEDSDIDSPYRKTICAGHYLCMYYNEGHLERYHKSFKLVKDYIKERHYEICGNILQFYKVDVTLTGRSDEAVIELQVPIRKKTE